MSKSTDSKPSARAWISSLPCCGEKGSTFYRKLKSTVGFSPFCRYNQKAGLSARSRCLCSPHSDRLEWAYREARENREDSAPLLPKSERHRAKSAFHTTLWQPSATPWNQPLTIAFRPPREVMRARLWPVWCACRERSSIAIQRRACGCSRRRRDFRRAATI